MNEIRIEMHNAEIIDKGTQNVGKCAEVQNLVSILGSSKGGGSVGSLVASCDMGMVLLLFSDASELMSVFKCRLLMMQIDEVVRQAEISCRKIDVLRLLQNNFGIRASREFSNRNTHACDRTTR